MATTIAFSEPETYRDTRLDVELVDVRFVLTSTTGESAAGLTRVAAPRVDRTVIYTQLKGSTFYDETRLDPNEDDSDVRRVVAEVKQFRPQQLVVPSDDIEIAAGIAHQVISGARYNRGWIVMGNLPVHKY